jgi:hypothetical protein
VILKFLFCGEIAGSPCCTEFCSNYLTPAFYLLSGTVPGTGSDNEASSDTSTQSSSEEITGSSVAYISPVQNTQPSNNKILYRKRIDIGGSIN